MPSRIDEAGHTKALITQSRSTGRKAKMFSSCGTRTDNISADSGTHYQLSHPCVAALLRVTLSCLDFMHFTMGLITKCIQV